jgi:hypothetical protein
MSRYADAMTVLTRLIQIEHDVATARSLGPDKGMPLHLSETEARAILNERQAAAQAELRALGFVDPAPRGSVMLDGAVEKATVVDRLKRELNKAMGAPNVAHTLSQFCGCAVCMSARAQTSASPYYVPPPGS